MAEKKLDLELFQRLPKAELHCHLDGSLRIQTILELAGAAKIDLPSKDPGVLKKYLSIGERIGSLKEYISRFEIPLQVLQT
ncbi:MAG: adenosine deaminase, partial [Candidatus Marinimicrobia bacterium]|nr:adenosine deaminase [Candidatus Neomarinimicrobiota bacterium]